MRFRNVMVPLALAGVVLAGCGDNQAEGGTPAPEPTSAAPADNGVADLDAAAIVDKSIAALAAAGSYSLVGDMAIDGGRMSLDIKVSGDDVLGSMTMDAASVELLRVDGTMYVRPNQEFWEQSTGDSDAGAAMIELIGDRWAKVPRKEQGFDSFFEVADPTKLLAPEGELSKGERTTVDGVAAIAISDAGPGGTLYVATTGEPYPVVLEGPPGEGQIQFGNFGAGFTIEAPAAADVVDLGKLKK